jgi:hypothetical protein
VVEHAAHDRVGALGELLVGDLQRLVAEAEEVGVPRGVVRGQLAHQIVDRAEGEDGLARASLAPVVAGAGLAPPGLRLHGLPQRDRLADLVAARDLHVAQAGKGAREQVGQGAPGVALDAAQQLGEVAEVAPHDLRAEHAVGRRALAQRPREVLVIDVRAPQRVGLGRVLGHLAKGQALDDVGVAVGVEVLVRAARRARAAQRLEVLLRAPCQARPIELVAE